MYNLKNIHDARASLLATPMRRLKALPARINNTTYFTSADASRIQHHVYSISERDMTLLLSGACMIVQSLYPYTFDMRARELQFVH